MNVENWNKLISFLETEVRDKGEHDEGAPPNQIFFDMQLWNKPEDCGTFCCIGGASEILFKSNRAGSLSLDEAAEIYGMPVMAMEQLFYPTVSDIHGYTLTRKEAVELLKDIRDGRALFYQQEWCYAADIAA